MLIVIIASGRTYENMEGFFNTVRKLEGLLGRCMISSMNHAHAALADWWLPHLSEFDLMAAFETVYFWPGPAEIFRDVYRTL